MEAFIHSSLSVSCLKDSSIPSNLSEFSPIWKAKVEEVCLVHSELHQQCKGQTPTNQKTVTIVSAGLGYSPNPNQNQ